MSAPATTLLARDFLFTVFFRQCISVLFLLWSIGDGDSVSATHIDNKVWLNSTGFSTPVKPKVNSLTLESSLLLEGTTANFSGSRSTQIRILPGSNCSFSVTTSNSWNEITTLISLNTLVRNKEIVAFKSGLSVSGGLLETHQERTELRVCRTCTVPLSIRMHEQSLGNILKVNTFGSKPSEIRLNASLVIHHGLHTKTNRIALTDGTLLSTEGLWKSFYLNPTKNKNASATLQGGEHVGHNLLLMSKGTSYRLAGGQNVTINGMLSESISEEVLKVDCSKTFEFGYVCWKLLVGGVRDTVENVSDAFHGLRLTGQHASYGTMLLKPSLTTGVRQILLPDDSGVVLTAPHLHGIENAHVHELYINNGVRVDGLFAVAPALSAIPSTITFLGTVHATPADDRVLKFRVGHSKSVLGVVNDATRNRAIIVPDASGTLLTTGNMDAISEQVHTFKKMSVQKDLHTRGSADLGATTQDFPSEFKSSLIMEGSYGLHEGSHGENYVHIRGGVRGRCTTEEIAVKFLDASIRNWASVIAYSSYPHGFATGDVIHLVQLNGRNKTVLKAPYGIRNINTTHFEIKGLLRVPPLVGSVACSPHLSFGRFRGTENYVIVLPYDRSNNGPYHRLVLPPLKESAVVLTEFANLSQYINLSTNKHVHNLRLRGNVAMGTGTKNGTRAGSVTFSGSLLNGPCKGKIAFIESIVVGSTGAIVIQTRSAHFFKENDRIYVGPFSLLGRESRFGTYIVSNPGNRSFIPRHVSYPNSFVSSIDSIMQSHANVNYLEYVVRCRTALKFAGGTSLDIQNPTHQNNLLLKSSNPSRLITTGNLVEINKTGILNEMRAKNTMTSRFRTTLGDGVNGATAVSVRGKLKVHQNNGSNLLLVQSLPSVLVRDAIMKVSARRLHNGSVFRLNGRTSGQNDGKGTALLRINAPSLQAGRIFNVGTKALASGSAFAVKDKSFDSGNIRNVVQLTTNAILSSLDGAFRVHFDGQRGTPTKFYGQNLTTGTAFLVDSKAGVNLPENIDKYETGGTVEIDTRNPGNRSLLCQYSVTDEIILQSWKDELQLHDVIQVKWTAVNPPDQDIDVFPLKEEYLYGGMSDGCFIIIPPASEKVWTYHSAYLDRAGAKVQGVLSRIPGTIFETRGNWQTRGTIASLEAQKLKAGTILRVESGANLTTGKLLHVKCSSGSAESPVVIEQKKGGTPGQTLLTIRTTKNIGGTLLDIGVTLGDTATRLSKLMHVQPGTNQTVGRVLEVNASRLERGKGVSIHDYCSDCQTAMTLLKVRRSAMQSLRPTLVVHALEATSGSVVNIHSQNMTGRSTLFSASSVGHHKGSVARFEGPQLSNGDVVKIHRSAGELHERVTNDENMLHVAGNSLSNGRAVHLSMGHTSHGETGTLLRLHSLSTRTAGALALVHAPRLMTGHAVELIGNGLVNGTALELTSSGNGNSSTVQIRSDETRGVGLDVHHRGVDRRGPAVRVASSDRLLQFDSDAIHGNENGVFKISGMNMVEGNVLHISANNLSTSAGHALHVDNSATDNERGELVVFQGNASACVLRIIRKGPLAMGTDKKSPCFDSAVCIRTYTHEQLHEQLHEKFATSVKIGCTGLASAECTGIRLNATSLKKPAIEVVAESTTDEAENDIFDYALMRVKGVSKRSPVVHVKQFGYVDDNMTGTPSMGVFLGPKETKHSIYVEYAGPRVEKGARITLAAHESLTNTSRRQTLGSFSFQKIDNARQRQSLVNFNGGSSRGPNGRDGFVEVMARQMGTGNTSTGRILFTKEHSMIFGGDSSSQITKPVNTAGNATSIIFGGQHHGHQGGGILIVPGIGSTGGGEVIMKDASARDMLRISDARMTLNVANTETSHNVVNVQIPSDSTFSDSLGPIISFISGDPGLEMGGSVSVTSALHIGASLRVAGNVSISNGIIARRRGMVDELALETADRREIVLINSTQGNTNMVVDGNIHSNGLGILAMYKKQVVRTGAIMRHVEVCPNTDVCFSGYTVDFSEFSPGSIVFVDRNDTSFLDLDVQFIEVGAAFEVGFLSSQSGCNDDSTLQEIFLTPCSTCAITAIMTIHTMHPINNQTTVYINKSPPEDQKWIPLVYGDGTNSNSHFGHRLIVMSADSPTFKNSKLYAGSRLHISSISTNHLLVKGDLFYNITAAATSASFVRSPTQDSPLWHSPSRI